MKFETVCQMVASQEHQCENRRMPDIQSTKRTSVMNTDFDREKARLMMATFDEMSRFTEPFITAIYDVIDEKSGQLMGSGTFIDLRGSPYILTAGHVAYEALTHRGLAHSTKNGSPPGFISNPLKLAGPPYDIGIVRLDQESLVGTQRACVSSNFLAETSAGVESDLLFVHGFPGKRSRPIALLQSVFATTLPYGTATGSSQYPWFDPALHIALDYSPAGMLDGKMDQPDFVEPFGLSGTALWKTNRAGTTSDEWTPHLARIVGVLFAWDQKTNSLIAVRIEVIREFLLQFLREEYAYFRWVNRGRPANDDWSDWHAAVRNVPSL
jgi:hypothetical protein